MPSDEMLAKNAALQAYFTDLPSIEQRRQASSAVSPLSPDVVREDFPLDAGPGERLWVDGAPPTRAVLYFHGGGFVAGSPSIARPFACQVSRLANVRFLMPAYRLAPEYPFPAAVDDAISAYRWVLAHGCDARHLIVAGTSAGGGLALVTMLRAREEGLPLPAGGVLVCPFTDLTLSSASAAATDSRDPLPLGQLGKIVGHYLGDHDPRDPWASPLHAELAGLPPLHFEIGTADRLVDDTRSFAAKARDAGVAVTVAETEEALHSFPHLVPDCPESAAAVERIAEHVRECLAYAAVAT